MSKCTCLFQEGCIGRVEGGALNTTKLQFKDIYANTAFMFAPRPHLASFYHVLLCHFTRRLLVFTKTWRTRPSHPVVQHAKLKAVLTNGQQRKDLAIFWAKDQIPLISAKISHLFI